MSELERDEQAVRGLADLRPGELRVHRVPWPRAVAARAKWWIWPYGLMLIAFAGGLLARSAARGRIELMTVLLSLVPLVLLVVGIIVHITARNHPGRLVCRIAVPRQLAERFGLRPRRALEPRLLMTSLIAPWEGGGLALHERGGHAMLRDHRAQLIIACSKRGRIGWAIFEVDGEQHRTACAGRLIIEGVLQGSLGSTS